MQAPGSRVVRVFISSTFRDFQEERDLLMRRVFPELQRRARDRFVEVIGLDLRWGITEEESERGETLPICLREIERSRPYFLGLLGERYGWTPHVGHYPEWLLEQQPWLRSYVGGKSVTELEFLHGVLNDPAMAGKAFFYFRNSAYAAGRGDDFASEGEPERARLASLKQRIRGSSFPVTEFPNPESFADLVTDHLWRLIDAEYPADSVPDELERQRRGHEVYALERRRLYVGQEATVARLIGRLRGASDEPGESGSHTRITLVTGESGSGKSALIANVLARHREDCPEDVIIEHYVGSASEASDPMVLMSRVAQELRRLTQSAIEIESDPDKLIEQFPLWVVEGASWAGRRGVRLVLALDALDRLESQRSLRWLPRILPPHVRLVVSALEGESLDVLRSRGAPEIVVSKFNEDVAREFIVQTLASRSRRLPASEVDRIAAHPSARVPIFLQTLMDELAVFGSHDGLPERITQCLRVDGPAELFQLVLDRVEGDLGRDAVQGTLQSIWASSDGMTDEEIVAFTRASPLSIARTRLALGDALYESFGRLRLWHSFVGDAVERRYVPLETQRIDLHQQLGQWWRTRMPSRRASNEAITHLLLAGAWQDLGLLFADPIACRDALLWVANHKLLQALIGVSGEHGEKFPSEFIERSLSRCRAAWEADLQGDLNALASALEAEVDFLEFASCCGGEALESTERLVSVRKLQVDRGDDCSRLRHLSRALHARAFLMRQRDSLPEALQIAGEMLEVSRRLAEQFDSPSDWNDVRVALCAIALSELDAAEFKSAQEHFDSALEIALKLAEREATPENLKAVSFSFRHRARCKLQSGEVDSARADLEHALVFDQRVATEFDDRGGWLNIADGLGQVARIECDLGDFGKAMELAEEGLRIAEAIAEEFGTPGMQKLVATHLDICGVIELEKGNLEGALGRFQSSLGVFCEVATMARTPAAARNVGLALSRMASVEHELGRLDAALNRYKLGLDTFRGIAARCDIPEFRRDIAVSLVRIGRIEQVLGAREGALACYLEALEIRRSLVREVGTPESRRDLSIVLERLGDLRKAQGDLRAASASFAESLAIRRELIGLRRGRRAMRDLAVIAGRVASLAEAQGDRDAAVAAYRESLELQRELHQDQGLKRGSPETTRRALQFVRASIDGIGAHLFVDPVKAMSDLADARNLIEWCESLEGFGWEDLGLLAEWWEQAALVAGRAGNDVEAAEARAVARRWRIRQGVSSGQFGG